MGSTESWSRTPEQRAELVAKARAWRGTQREFAEVHGVSQPTVSKWVSSAPAPTRSATAPRSLAVRPPRVPAMLEVVAVEVPPVAVKVESACPVGARLALPGGAELRFDALPSARWVAELAAELARC